jgi:hypothetical protein
LRFVLIGWVVLYHLDLTLRVTGVLPWLRPVLGVGYLGVDGFFLLSGFALWLGYGSRSLLDFSSFGRFLLRRLAKIWPLHALALLALLAVVGLAQVGGVAIRDPERFRAGDFLLQLFLVNAWETTERHAWNYPSWALSVEWAGYLAFPAALLLFRRSRTVFLVALAAAAVAGLFWLTALAGDVGLNHTLHLGLVRFALEFSLGLALGRLATEGWLPRVPVLAFTLAVPLGLGLRWDALTVVGAGGGCRGALAAPRPPPTRRARTSAAAPRRAIVRAFISVGFYRGRFGGRVARSPTRDGRARPSYGGAAFVANLAGRLARLALGGGDGAPPDLDGRSPGGLRATWGRGAPSRADQPESTEDRTGTPGARLGPSAWAAPPVPAVGVGPGGPAGKPATAGQHGQACAVGQPRRADLAVASRRRPVPH